MIVYKYFLKSFLKMKYSFLLWMGIFVMITLAVAGLPENEKEEFANVIYNISVPQSVNSELVTSIKEAFDDKAVFAEIPNDELSAKESIFADGADIAFYQDKTTGALSAYTNELDMKSHMAAAKLDSYLSYLEITKKNGVYDYETARKIADAEIEVHTVKEKKEKPYVYYWYNNTFRFIVYPLMSMVMSIIGMAIIQFKDKSVEARIGLSSTKLLTLSIAEFSAQIVATVVITILSFVIMVGIGRNFDLVYLYYFLNMLVFALSSLGLIFLIYNINSHEKFIASVSNTFSLVLAFISGVFVPSAFLPEIANNIAMFFPMHYYIKANTLAIEGWSGDFGLYLSIQMLFAICFFLAGVFIKKIKVGKRTKLAVSS